MKFDEVAGWHDVVVSRGVMFCEVIGKVVCAFLPVYDELALIDMIANPLEAHVNGLGLALFDGIVGNAGGAEVVCLNMDGTLPVAHVVQGGLEHAGVFCI